MTESSFRRLHFAVHHFAFLSLFRSPSNLVFPPIAAFLQAFCETLEESNYRLQKELQEKQKEIGALKRMLEEKEKAILLLERHIKSVDLHKLAYSILSKKNKKAEAVKCVLYIVVLNDKVKMCVCVCCSGERMSLESPCGVLSAPGSVSSADADVESSTAEADQDIPDNTG